jgi:glycerophosphoryl diester phosphodiesterase
MSNTVLKSLGKVLFLAILFLASCQPQSNFDKVLSEFHDTNSEYIMIAAHRAAHNIHPENSIPAIQHSIEMGVDIIELDVKVSKDGVPFLMHDGTIDRTTNGTGDGEDYTIAELKKLRLMNNDGTLSEETIPTFEEALNVTKGKAMIDIDIKTSHLKEINDVIEGWYSDDFDEETGMRKKK